MSETDAAFRFTYDATFADYRALLRARQRLGRLGGHGRWLRYPFVVLLFVATLWWLDGLRAPWSVYLRWDVAGWIIGLVLFIPLVDLFFERVLGRWVYSRYAAADRPVSAAVDAEGVSWVVDAWSGRFAWTGVKSSVATTDYLFLFLGKLEAITLPRRGLVDGDWDSLLAFVAARLPKPPVSG
jgi:hypothetical protein